MLDVAIIGGGHNGLVAACYLAKSGLQVRLFEASEHLGGATASEKVFDGIDARLSRYSYLVSLLPDEIVRDLGLNFETISRRISSFTPYRSEDGSDHGLLISNDWSEAESVFSYLGLEGEAHSWRSFYDQIASVAPSIAGTFLSPLPSRDEMRKLIGSEAFDLLFTTPLGHTLLDRFQDDRVRGIVLTDALIGTFTDACDPGLLANRCFLYHLVGNGDGQWRVPRGGMGALVAELRRVALSYGVTIETNRRVVSIDETVIHLADEVKINMVLQRLPRLRSGVDPKDAFAGTFHIDESYDQLQRAFTQASSGSLPDQIPAEIYCHTLTDSSILAPELVAAGYQTLTLFALHTPYDLFVEENERVKGEVRRRLFDQINAYLIDPLEECLARDGNGDLAIEIKSPIDLEEEIGLPLGNIFHADLTFPWREDHETIRWGSETEFENIFLAGAGSRRGGGVSGIGGQNAAMAILERLSLI